MTFFSHEILITHYIIIKDGKRRWIKDQNNIWSFQLHNYAHASYLVHNENLAKQNLVFKNESEKVKKTSSAGI